MAIGQLDMRKRSKGNGVKEEGLRFDHVGNCWIEKYTEATKELKGYLMMEALVVSGGGSGHGMPGRRCAEMVPLQG